MSKSEELKTASMKYHDTSLSPRQAEIWAGWFELGWTPRQVGETLGLTPDSVRVVIHKIGEKLASDHRIVGKTVKNPYLSTAMVEG